MQKQQGYTLVDLTNLRLVSRQYNDIVEPQAFETLSLKFSSSETLTTYLESKLVAIASGTSPHSRWAKRVNISELEESLGVLSATHYRLRTIQEKWLIPVLEGLSHVEELMYVLRPCLSEAKYFDIDLIFGLSAELESIHAATVSTQPCR